MVRMIEPGGPQALPVARDDASPADADPASDGALEVFALPLTTRADERAARLLAEADGRRYRFLAKAIPQIVWTASPRGRVDSFNPRWGEYTGLAPDGHPDADWLATLHPEDVRRWRVAWAQARQVGSNFSIDLRLRRRDGTFRWHLARALPVLDRPGQAIVKWLGTCTDIDDQKRAEGMLGFLAEVSTALASSLDYETTLAAVARLAVPHVADWCVVDIAEPDGSIRRLAVAHADPARVELGWKLGADYPPRPDDAEGVAPVLRSGRTELVAAVDAAHLDRAARSPAHRALLESLGLTSTVAAPLVARGRTTGVITLAMAESGRAYTAADLPFVEDLARRAAMAVDNARLYREAQQAPRRGRGGQPGQGPLPGRARPRAADPADAGPGRGDRAAGRPQHHRRVPPGPGDDPAQR